MPPPDAPGWVEEAVAWLLDLCPPEYRSHEVLRRYPLVLARFTAHHVTGCLTAAREGYGAVRRELRDLVDPEAVQAALVAYEREGARLAAVERQVDLVEEALRGHRFRPRL